MTFTEEQQRLRFQTEITGDWYAVAEVDRFVEELCRHFPGLAGAIRAVASHCEEKMSQAPCCTSVRTHVGPGSLAAELE